MTMIVCKNFAFMSLSTALIDNDSHVLAGIYLIFLKKLPRQNFEDFQYQLWSSVNWSEK